MLKSMTFRSTLAAVACATSFSVYAMANGPTQLNIPAGNLIPALEALEKQAAIELVFRSEQVKSFRTKGVTGTYEPKDAVRILLKGTSLELRTDPTGVMVIVPAHTSISRTRAQSLTAGDSAQPDDSRSGLQLPQSTPGQPSSTATVEQKSGKASDSSVLQEVIVTAQKKSENIQDIPLSVSAVSSEWLARFNATQLSDYAATIPGLQVDGGGVPGYMTVSLRGVTTGSLFGTATTGVYVDDVPTGSSSNSDYGASFGIDLLPFDLDHVEVLKGPQGTLYGSSSMGGLLKYVLTTPDLATSSFRAGADVSTVDQGSGTGDGARIYANLALVPGELAISISGAHNYIPGFITNIANGQRGINNGTQNGARLALLWQPNEQFSVKLSALLNESNFDNSAEVPVTPAGTPLYGRLETKLFEPNGLQNQTTLYSADIQYRFAWATLTSITGYSDVQNHWDIDGSGKPYFESLGVLAPFVDRPDLKKISEEVRLASPDHQRLQWLLGGFYTKEEAKEYEEGRALNPVTLAPNPLYDPLDNIVIPSTYKETAGFGNATYNLTDLWDISGGVRESHIDQSASAHGNGVNGSAGFLFGDLTAPFAGPEVKASEDVFTYSASSRYHFAPDAMLYARVATGYRPGGSNGSLPGAPPTYSADRTTNYEVGVKSELLDKRLLLDGDVFYIDWSKLQIEQFTATQQTFTGNAGRAVSKGFELTTRYALTRELRFGGNVAFIDATLTSDAPAVGAVNGDRLPLSARWNASVTGDWAHTLMDDYSLTAGAVWRYVGDRYADFAGGANYLKMSAYNSFDLSVGITNGRWTMNLYGKNVTNEYAYLRYYKPYATVLPPRTVGLSLDVRF